MADTGHSSLVIGHSGASAPVLLVLAGPAGSGKTTLCERMVAEVPGFERVITTARDAGALVLLDVKRGDIGSTSEAYAEAYLDPASPIAADAITVSPFLGFGSLDPFVDAARKHDAGLFVLARTSNKEAPEVQAARTDDGVSVTGTILGHLRALNAGAEPLGSFGAVVGATIGDTGEDFAFNGPILAPGYGAQGGTAADLPRIFGAALPAVLPSSSRELLRVGPDAAAMRDAARRTNDELRSVLGSWPASGE